MGHGLWVNDIWARRGDPVAYRLVSLFVCFFLSARLRENGWTDLHEIFKEGVDCGVTTGRQDNIFGQFRETARCHDAQHGGGFVVLSHHCNCLEIELYRQLGLSCLARIGLLCDCRLIA